MTTFLICIGKNLSPAESKSKFIGAQNSVAKEGALETGSGDQPGMSCCCPLLPWLQGLLEPLELRREEAKVHASAEGMGMLIE